EISGTVSQSSRGLYDYWICKIDSAGNKLWDKRFGGGSNDYLRKIENLQNNGFLLIGESQSSNAWDRTVVSPGFQDIWMIKIDNLGQKQWDKSIVPKGSGAYTLIDSQIDSSGFIYILTNRFTFNNNPLNENIISKLKQNGDILWSKTLINSNSFKKINLNSQGFQVVGALSSITGTYFKGIPRGGNDGFIAQYDFDGNPIWDKFIGGTLNDNFNVFLGLKDSSIVLGGSSSSNVSYDKSQPTNGSSDFWFTKIKEKLSVSTDPLGINLDEKLELVVNNCPGIVTWSTNPVYQGPLLSVSPSFGDSYISTCNAYGCVFKDTVQILQNCSSNFSVIVKNDSNIVVNDPLICNGNSNFKLKAINCSGTIAWSTGSILDSILVSTTRDSTIIATCSNSGCASVVKKVYLKALEIPLISNQGLSNFCQNDSTILKIEGRVNPNREYEWYKDDVLISNSYMKKQIFAKSAGNYKLKLFNNQCASFSNSISITTIAIPNPPTFSSSDYYTCFNTPIRVTANGCSGELSWDNTTNSLTSRDLNSNGYNSQTYSVTCKGSTCTSHPAVIRVNCAFNYIQGNSSKYICNEDSLSLYSIKNCPGSFRWYRDNTIIPNQTSSIIKVKKSGYYNSEITLSNGCIVKSNKAELIKVDSMKTPILSSIDTSSTHNNIVKIWDKSYGFKIGNTYGFQLLKTIDLNYILIGQTNPEFDEINQTITSKGKEDIYIVKVDSLGSVIWDNSYGGNDVDFVGSAQVTNDGGVLIASYSRSNRSGNLTSSLIGGYDVLLIKIDNNGNIIWDKRFGGIGDEQYPQIIKTSDNKYLLSYQIKKDNSVFDIGLVKINDLGEVLWSKTYVNAGSNKVTSLVNSLDGGYFIVSESNTSNTLLDRSGPVFGGNDIWLIKTDINGNKIWDKSYGGSNYDNNPKLIQNTDSSIYIACNSASGVSGNKTSGNFGRNDFWVFKTNSQGMKIWDNNYGGSKDEYLNGIFMKPNNNLVLLGNTTSSISNDILDNNFENSSADYPTTDGLLFEIRSQTGAKILQKRFGGMSNDFLYNMIYSNDKYILFGSTNSFKSGNKNSNFIGVNGTNMWLIKAQISNPTISTPNIEILPGQGVTLTATDCIGAINWSNGQTGNSISVSPSTNTTYSANCNFDGCIKTTSVLVKVVSCGRVSNLTQTDNIVTGTSSLPVVKRAFNTIHATNYIGNNSLIGVGKYISGNTIELNPGFKVEVGSIFQAQISNDPCNE
ncbi:MAG: 3-coathanger stack domain-containing protein, partial [Leadbetterella sp.]